MGIDSSGLVASVAVVEDGRMLGEFTIDHKKTHSETLLPMLDEVVNALDLSLDTIDAIAVAKGPGSFTGLRIGSATAKGLGLALDKPVIGVSTLEALAYNLYGAGRLVCPIMDARRQQVYTGVYFFMEDEEGMEMKTMLEDTAMGIDELVDVLHELRGDVIFLGDGVPVFRDYIRDNLMVDFWFAPEHLNKQRAGAVAALGLKYYKEGRFETADEFRPEYLRLSQAERERNERLNSEKLKNTDEAAKERERKSNSRKNVQTRLAKASDAGKIAELSMTSLHEGWKEEDVRKAIEDENAVVLYTYTSEADETPDENGDYSDNIPVAYSLCYSAGGEAELLGIATAEAFRRKNVAHKLLSYTMGLLRTRGIHRLVLEVREGNAAAIGLYRKLGFEEIGRRKDFYTEPQEDAVLMGVDFKNA